MVRRQMAVPDSLGREDPRLLDGAREGGMLVGEFRPFVVQRDVVIVDVEVVQGHRLRNAQTAESLPFQTSVRLVGARIPGSR
jgi:hypothetical protein